MVAQNPTYQDGVWYQKGQEVWDLGSWKADPRETDGMFRSYKGLSTDKEKLPHYVETGSSAFCVDTLEIGYFEKTTNTWYWS